MADVKRFSGAQDRRRINVNEDVELRDWSLKLRVSPEQLKKAVASVGDRAGKVQDYLSSSKSK